MAVKKYKGSLFADQYQIREEDCHIDRESVAGEMVFTDEVSGSVKLSDLFATASSKLITDENLSSQLDGSTVALTLANTIDNPIMVNLNGGILIKDVDYTATGTTFTFISKYAVAGDIPILGESLYITYYKQ